MTATSQARALQLPPHSKIRHQGITSTLTSFDVDNLQRSFNHIKQCLERHWDGEAAVPHFSFYNFTSILDKMISALPFTAITAILLLPSALAQGIYSKSSPVLQVDGSNYHDLIAKSNHTSIVELVGDHFIDHVCILITLQILRSMVILDLYKSFKLDILIANTRKGAAIARTSSRHTKRRRSL